MTEPLDRLSIEFYIRDEAPPDEDVLIVRAGPMTVEKFVDHMRREQERYSYRGRPMASISVDATVDGWTLEAILRDRLWSRTTFATVPVGGLVRAGYELLPTFDAPHFDVLLPKSTPEVAGSLLSLFGLAERNPYRRRR